MKRAGKIALARETVRALSVRRVVVLEERQSAPCSYHSSTIETTERPPHGC